MNDDASPPATAAMTALMARDAFAGGMGFRLVGGGPGWARVAVDIDGRHLNFFDWAHGGAIFALADTAFGLASNSHDAVSVGIDAHIAYLNGVRAGDEIVAEATEVSRTRRKAVYRIEVTRTADGKAIAAFTGTVFVTGESIANLTAD